MRRVPVVCLCVSLLVLIALAHGAAAEPAQTGQPAPSPKKRPVGVYTADDGETITVGIGTLKPVVALDVTRGEVKLGSTGMACSEKIAGSLRYAGQRLQLCDGTGWRNVSLDKAE